MNKLYAGFARTNVTPMMGIGLIGYFHPRYADGVLDELEINALAVSVDDKKAVLLSFDNEGVEQVASLKLRQAVSQACGIPVEAVYLHATHTHTGPSVSDTSDPLVPEYAQFVTHKMADVAKAALEDLKPAKMGYGIGQAPNVAFVRRFRMKDGSLQTNPGVNNPNIDHPVGDVDERVNVVRFDQEGGKSLVLVNFGNHPDTIGGNKISGDWPALVRPVVENALENTRCIFFNGVQGDVNHVNVFPAPGFLNDTFNDFDDVARGYGHTRYIARCVAGAVMQVYDKVAYVDVDKIGYAQKILSVPAQKATPEELVEAHRINDLHLAGKDDQLPYRGMMLTTVVAEAGRMVNLEHAPDTMDMTLSAVAIGPIVMAGIPGEPFTGIGRSIKLAEGWGLVLPTCMTNGCQGYFPMMDAYEEGGYEARSSKYSKGVAETIAEESKKLLATLL